MIEARHPQCFNPSWSHQRVGLNFYQQKLNEMSIHEVDHLCLPLKLKLNNLKHFAETAALNQGAMDFMAHCEGFVVVRATLTI